MGKIATRIASSASGHARVIDEKPSTTANRFPFKVTRDRSHATDAFMLTQRRERPTSTDLLSRPTTMGEPGPSRSRILAALDLTEDDSSSSLVSTPTPTLPSSLLSRQLGEKRKRGAEYISAIAAPVNKRQTSVSGTSSRSAVNSLPAGLLASIQSQGKPPL